MDEEVQVHPRVMERHSKITEENVLEAWQNFVRKQRRQHPRGDQVVAIGFDHSGRQLGMVAKVKGSDCLIYHAMTPPTKAILLELNLARRQ